MVMEDIISWLCNIEDLARNLYTRAADRFKGDQVLSDLLRRLAEDEAQHYRLLKSARDSFRDKESPQFAISVDAAARDRVEKPFHDSLTELKHSGWGIEYSVSAVAVINTFSLIQITPLNFSLPNPKS